MFFSARHFNNFTIYFRAVGNDFNSLSSRGYNSDILKFSLKFLIVFSAITTNKLWSLNYLKDNFNKNEFEKKIY